ncbi:MAG: hypothetical protein ACLTCI_11240 [[Clostridium] nexile]
MRQRKQEKRLVCGESNILFTAEQERAHAERFYELLKDGRRND